MIQVWVLGYSIYLNQWECEILPISYVYDWKSNREELREMPGARSEKVDKRSEDRKRAEKLYIESKGILKLVEIAEILRVPDNKIRKWKSLDKWEEKLHPPFKK